MRAHTKAMFLFDSTKANLPGISVAALILACLVVEDDGVLALPPPLTSLLSRFCSTAGLINLFPLKSHCCGIGSACYWRRVPPLCFAAWCQRRSLVALAERGCLLTGQRAHAQCLRNSAAKAWRLIQIPYFCIVLCGFVRPRDRVTPCSRPAVSATSAGDPSHSGCRCRVMRIRMQDDDII
jgi:hypothetical protein